MTAQPLPRYCTWCGATLITDADGFFDCPDCEEAFTEEELNEDDDDA